MRVTWFRHSHENRNDLLRFGLMQLHYENTIRYIERPFADMIRFGFSKKITNYPDPRHLSFLLVENGRQKIRCLFDNEDSFALITPLIAEVDVCFCAGYNSDFFEKHSFVRTYNWQTEDDVKGYRQLLENKIEKLGLQFYKIKKFIPIAPNQGILTPIPLWKQRVKNVGHRIKRVMGEGSDFSDVYKAFERRQQYLKELRNSSLVYDIVLNDSLWGWPQHRINLHSRLQQLHAEGYSIHSVLNWNEAVAVDGSCQRSYNASAFPMKTASISDDYELMLSKSRLAVFACGFHWGWRNIMMLALQVGVPVLTDRLLTEAYFDMNEFHLYQHEDHHWNSVEDLLKSIDTFSWEKSKKHNQAIYDKYMSPKAVAQYFLRSIDIGTSH